MPLNCSITLSAPEGSTNTNSAITVGVLDTSRQLVSSPPTLSMTLSISAAVVPGAKFCATMTTGAEAAPLILRPAPPPLPFAKLLLLREPTSGRVDEGREGTVASEMSLRRRLSGAAAPGRVLRELLLRGRDELCGLLTPTRLARLPVRPLGPADGALERRPLPRSFWARFSAAFFLRPAFRQRHALKNK